MKRRGASSFFAALAAGSLLGGCNASLQQPSVGTLPAPGTRATRSAQREQPHGWMSPDARGNSLLYVSDSERARVNVYARYLSRKPILEGQLTGFSYPIGACTDRSANVYVTDFYAVNIVEYAHAGTTPLRTIPLQGSPIGCSVDPTTGNLAVAIWEGAQGYNTPGGVFIFQSASGTPTLYTPGLWQIFPPVYDNKGNLFLLGYNPTVELLELRRGGGAFDQISLGSTQFWAPGSVLWDGKHVNAIDQQYNGGDTTAIYRIAVKGNSGKTLHTTILSDNCNPYGAYVFQPSIIGSKILGPNHSCSSRFDYWNANGGTPVHSLSAGIAPEDGNGQTISP